MNRFLEFFINKNTSNTLTKEQEAIVSHDIEIINFKRMNLFLCILLIIELLFIKFSDIPNLKHNINGIWNDKRYFIAHVCLSILCLVGIIILNILIKKDKGFHNKIHKFVVPVLTIIMLILASFINGLDQIKIGNASSVFIANILICSAVLMIEFPINLIVYLIPFATFIGGLFLFQKNPALLYSNIINGLIFLIAVLVISKAMYEHQYNQISKNMLLKEMNQRLNYISNHDSLTGLSNRRNFENQIKLKMEVLNQHNEEAALVLIDIDYFKQINDKFGHPIGDKVLKEISNILLENLKDTDLAARWGGEEFLLFLSPASIHEAYELSNKIRAAIEKKPLLIDKYEINVTASFGISKLTGTLATSFTVSYTLADKALYQAKNSGRNQVIVGSNSFNKTET